MKRKRKIIIVISLGAAVVLVLLFMAFSYKENHYHVCSTCYTRRFKDKWWVGYYAGPCLTIWSREVIKETNIYKTLFTPEHKHNWTFAHGYCVNIFPFFHTYGRFASGRGAKMNDFTGMYEYIPNFRDFIHKKVEQGRLTQDELRKILKMPPEDFYDSNSRARISELLQKALQLDQEFEKFQRVR